MDNDKDSDLERADGGPKLANDKGGTLRDMLDDEGAPKKEQVMAFNGRMCCSFPSSFQLGEPAMCCRIRIVQFLSNFVQINEHLLPWKFVYVWRDWSEQPNF